MSITRAIAAAVAFAGGSVGLATPAWADEPGGPLNGTYEVVTLGSQRFSMVGDQRSPDPDEDVRTPWVLAPCGDGCTTVTSSTGWSAEMRLADGRWQMSRPAGGATCNGTESPSTFEYSFDATTLAGSARQAGECDGKPAYTESPSSLVKVG